MDLTGPETDLIDVLRGLGPGESIFIARDLKGQWTVTSVGLGVVHGTGDIFELAWDTSITNEMGNQGE